MLALSGAGQSKSEDFIPHKYCAVPGISPETPAPSAAIPALDLPLAFGDEHWGQTWQLS